MAPGAGDAVDTGGAAVAAEVHSAVDLELVDPRVVADVAVRRRLATGYKVIFLQVALL